MAQEKHEAKTGVLGKFSTTLLVLLGALFSFGGPYLSYLLISFEINYAYSMILGLVLFLIGLALIVYLARKRMVT